MPDAKKHLLVASDDEDEDVDTSKAATPQKSAANKADMVWPPNSSTAVSIFILFYLFAFYL